MTHEQLLALLVFAFVTSITPGPNNLMLMASGANFGLRRTVPHILGVGVGFVVMVMVVGAGLAGAFAAVPWARDALKAASVCCLLHLAWTVATAAPPGNGRATAHPMTFLGATAFRWVNPKGWTMALTAVSACASARTTSGIVAAAVVFGAVNLRSVGTWTVPGHGMNTLLTDPGRMRAFNAAMALLLVASLCPILTR